MKSLNGEYRPPIPDWLADRIRFSKNWMLMIPAKPIRDIIGWVEPGISNIFLALLMDRDEGAVRRIYKEDWISEEKADLVLTALHCSHLWYEPPLKEFHEAIMEYEALYTQDEQLELVAA